MLDGVRLHAYPLYIDYTWGLMAWTLRQVEEEMEVKGNWACQWEVAQVGEGGELGRIWGRGELGRDEG